MPDKELRGKWIFQKMSVVEYFNMGWGLNRDRDEDGERKGTGITAAASRHHLPTRKCNVIGNVQDDVRRVKLA